MKKKGRIVGIDLGTTNSSVAVWKRGRPCIIPNPLGNLITPSVVRFLENGEVIIGDNAVRARLVDPKNTITGAKRFIGRRFNEVFDIAANMPFDVFPGDNNLAMFWIGGKEYPPQLVSGLVLKALKQAAESYLGAPVSGAVITVPGYFGPAQRQATIEAGEIAGLEVCRLVNEPVAACLAHRHDLKGNLWKVAVLDLGGGTFDVTIIEGAFIEGEHQFEVLGVAGDGFLGGDDFDSQVHSWLVEEIRQHYGLEFLPDTEPDLRVREAAVQVKHELSERDNAKICLPFLGSGRSGVVNVDLVLTRAKFEEICAELFERLAKPCETAMDEAGCKLTDLDHVLMVGGGTRISGVRDTAARVFGRSPRTLVNAQQAVALGAAMEAAVLEGNERNVLLLNVLPHSLGVEIANGVTCVIVEANTTIPTLAKQIFTGCQNGQTSVEIHAVEGESPWVDENYSLGRLVMDGIPPLHGERGIEVKFEVDTGGIPFMSVRDKRTSRENTVTLKGATGLTRADVLALKDFAANINVSF